MSRRTWYACCCLNCHSNLYGAYKFVNAIYNHPANKEIIDFNKNADTPSPLLWSLWVARCLYVKSTQTKTTRTMVTVKFSSQK